MRASLRLFAWLGLLSQLLLSAATAADSGKMTLPSVRPEEPTAKSPALRGPVKLVSTKIDFDAPPDPAGGDWKSLFDGKDLKGWTQKNGTATYRVEENSVVGRTNEGSPNSFLCTDKDYSDFELTFEVKVDDALNSGVQIRSRSTPEFNNGRVHGPQVEIETGGTAGYVYSEGTGRGWVSKEQKPTDAFKKGEWNRYLVRAVGPRIQTWINGRKIEDLSDEASFRSGFIGLQVHGIAKGSGPYEVRWRDIKIRNLAE